MALAGAAGRGGAGALAWAAEGRGAGHQAGHRAGREEEPRVQRAAAGGRREAREEVASTAAALVAVAVPRLLGAEASWAAARGAGGVLRLPKEGEAVRACISDARGGKEGCDTQTLQ